MRWFRHNSQGPDNEPELITMSEEEVRRNYYPYWIKQMHRVNKSDQINFTSCLEDWQTVHWAWELTPTEAEDYLKQEWDDLEKVIHPGTHLREATLGKSEL